MDLLSHNSFLEHDTGLHPESSKRLHSIGNLKNIEIPFDEDLLSTVHDREYINVIKSNSASATSIDVDTVLSEGSYKAAVYAAALSVAASKTGDFALVRPPGHHAYSKHGSGFCLFNNIAIATKTLVEKGKKVLIIDFDGHYGDGTASIFYDSADVLYFSIHQYPAFPNKGHESEIGLGEGKGFTVNMSIPAFAADDILFDGLDTLLPVLKKFSPDIVAVSAGFDAHQLDPLLQLRWSTLAYHNLGKWIRKNFANNFAVLEGGYNTDVLPECIKGFQAGINGKKFSLSERHTDSEILVWNEYEIRINNLLNQLKPYWEI